MVDNTSILAECRHKVARGKVHLKAVNGEVRGWSAKPYSVVREFDAKQSKYLFRLVFATPLPKVLLAVTIGDCVHNARSALDYLAWNLAGSDPNNREVQFPIFDSCKKFWDSKGRLKGIDEGAIAELAGLQPYTRPNVKESALWTLQQLDVRDKHKLLTMTEVAAGSSWIGGDHPFAVEIPIRRNGRIEDNAVIAEVPAPPGQDVTMKHEFSFDVLFERGIISATDDYEVSNTLEIIFETVDGIISRFEKLIAANPHWIK
jgi:hypothetical protein